MSVREISVLAPLAVAAIVLGATPQLFLEKIEPAAQRFVASVHARSRDHQSEASIARPRRKPERFPGHGTRVFEPARDFAPLAPSEPKPEVENPSESP
jgi:hypothetical protein